MLSPVPERSQSRRRGQSRNKGTSRSSAAVTAWSLKQLGRPLKSFCPLHFGASLPHRCGEVLPKWLCLSGPERKIRVPAWCGCAGAPAWVGLPASFLRAESDERSPAPQGQADP